MFTRISGEEIDSSAEVLAVRELMNDVAEELRGSLHRLRAGETGDAREMAKQIRDMRAAYQLAVEERARIARLRKDDAGIVYDYALDFDAARDEICRRLACLRDAGDGR
ncbi:MAG TPA: hypothetical protein PLI43_13735 [Albidovulum sp.]|uniref:hypothetical protein n=1 Tax=Albidovulum sp. TaxID=1872424 RepID=UPI002B64B525|nr:hypothetical protein [Albidovulum sp.]